MAYVYFIKVEGKDTFKVGYTENNPYQRLASLQTSCPFPISVYGLIETDKPRKLEAILHRQFEASKTTGEWFSIPVETVNAILIKHKKGSLVTRKKVKINLDICPHCGQDMPAEVVAGVKLSKRPARRIAKNKVIYAVCQCGCGQTIPEDERRRGKRYLNKTHARRAQRQQAA